MTTEAIKSAKTAMAAAALAMGEAKKVMASAKAVMDAAREQYNIACIARDANLPKCILRSGGRYSGKPTDFEVCIIKKTAKAVFVRRPGVDDDVGMQFRKSRHGGWYPYPTKGGRMGDSGQLILPEDVP